jgi:hypothetical protein
VPLKSSYVADDITMIFPMVKLVNSSLFLITATQKKRTSPDSPAFCSATPKKELLQLFLLMIIQWQSLFYDVTSCRSLTGIIGMGESLPWLIASFR